MDGNRAQHDGAMSVGAVEWTMRCAARRPVRCALLVWLLLIVIFATLAFIGGYHRRASEANVLIIAGHLQVRGPGARGLGGGGGPGIGLSFDYAAGSMFEALVTDPDNTALIECAAGSLGRAAPVLSWRQMSLWSTLLATPPIKAMINSSAPPVVHHAFGQGGTRVIVGDDPNRLDVIWLRWALAARILVLLQAAAILAVGGIGGPWILRRRARLRRGACTCCGHSRTGLAEERPCSECGAMEHQAASGRAGRASWAARSVAIVALVLGAVVMIGWPRHDRVRPATGANIALQGFAPPAPRWIVDRAWSGWPVPVLCALTSRPLDPQREGGLDPAVPEGADEDSFRRGWQAYPQWSWTSSASIPAPGEARQVTLLFDNLLVNLLFLEAIVAVCALNVIVARRVMPRTTNAPTAH